MSTWTLWWTFSGHLTSLSLLILDADLVRVGDEQVADAPVDVVGFSHERLERESGLEVSFYHDPLRRLGSDSFDGMLRGPTTFSAGSAQTSSSCLLAESTGQSAPRCGVEFDQLLDSQSLRRRPNRSLLVNVDNFSPRDIPNNLHHCIGPRRLELTAHPDQASSRDVELRRYITLRVHALQCLFAATLLEPHRVDVRLLQHL